MFERFVAKRLIKELEANVNGLRRMGRDYVEQGGFKEIAELTEKLKAGDVFPKGLIEEGRQIELQFADVCNRLADCYQKLLDFVKETIERKV